MSGPSDPFFVRWAEAAHSPVAPRIPELQARQAAAQAQGMSVTLAEAAVRMGFLPATALDELAKMETRYGPTPAAPAPAPELPVFAASSPAPLPASPPPAPSAPAPARLPSGRTPAVPGPARLPSGTAPSVPGGPARRPAPVAKPAPPSRTARLALAVGSILVLAGAGVVLAFVFGRGKPTDTPGPTVSPRASSAASPTPEPSPASSSAGSSPAPERTPAARPTPGVPGEDASPAPAPAAVDPEHRALIEGLAAEIQRLADAGDVAGARRKLDALRAGAREGDEDAVAIAERTVALAKPGPTPTPSPVAAPVAPSPVPSPALSEAEQREQRSREQYAQLRKALDPLLARFDLDGARAALAQAPALTGETAQSLEDDRAAPDALARLLELAEAGARRSVGKNVSLHLASGGKLEGTLRSVEGHDLAVATAAGGESLVRVAELDRKDVAWLAAQKLPKEDQEASLLGSGLAFLYGGEVEKARAALAKAQTPLARRFLERAQRGPAPEPAASPRRPDASPAASPAPGPVASPAGSAPAASPAAPAVDVVALQLAFQKLVHTPVNDEGGGRFSLVYDMSLERHALDFEARGAEKWDVSQGSRPGDQAKVLCGQLVAPAGSDVVWLHRIPLKGDFELAFTFFAAGLGADSTFTIVAGLDAKKRFLGAPLGQALVRNDGKKPVGAGPALDPTLLAGGKDVTVSLSRKGDKLTLVWNKEKTERASLDGCAGFDGRWGIVARGVRLGIRSVEAHGTPELPKK